MKLKAEIDFEIEEIKWSPDDSFIMMINYKKSQIKMRCIKNSAVEMGLEGWTASI